MTIDGQLAGAQRVMFGVGVGCLAVAAVLAMGCGSIQRGPSKDRLAQLLHECREANRERVRIIKDYDKAIEGCENVKVQQPIPARLWNMDEVTICPAFRAPEQNFGTINFGEAGN